VKFDHTPTREAIAAFYRAYNKLGFGFSEGVCVSALVYELVKAGCAIRREHPIDVIYEGVCLGTFRADLLVDNSLIVEVKADAVLGPGPERQLMNYLRCSDIEYGLLVVFGVKPRFKRLIHTRDRKLK
jgi:GxxExxY protein